VRVVRGLGGGRDGGGDGGGERVVRVDDARARRGAKQLHALPHQRAQARFGRYEVRLEAVCGGAHVAHARRREKRREGRSEQRRCKAARRGGESRQDGAPAVLQLRVQRARERAAQVVRRERRLGEARQLALFSRRLCVERAQQLRRGGRGQRHGARRRHGGA
jgi:hypothetical protein